MIVIPDAETAFAVSTVFDENDAEPVTVKRSPLMRLSWYVTVAVSVAS